MFTILKLHPLTNLSDHDDGSGHYNSNIIDKCLNKLPYLILFFEMNCDFYCLLPPIKNTYHVNNKLIILFTDGDLLKFQIQLLI